MIGQVNRGMRALVRALCVTAGSAIGATVALLALALLVAAIATLVPLSLLYVLAED